MFSLIINGTATEIIQNGKHGITLSPELIQILSMLFAEDVVFLSYTVTGLQQQHFEEYCYKAGSCCKLTEIKGGCVQK